MFGGIPFGFGGFEGMGGMPGGPSRNVDNNKFYDILGVGKEASEGEIKKAFRKLAAQHHPDKGRVWRALLSTHCCSTKLAKLIFCEEA